MGAFGRFHQFAMLGMVASSYLAVVSAQVLDLPTVVLSGLAIVARLVMTLFSRVPRVPDIIATAAAFLYLGFYPIDFYFVSQDFLQATVHLVFFLASLLIVRARTNRDYVWLEVVAFLQVLAAAAISQSAGFVIFLACFFLFGFASITSREMLNEMTRSGHATPAPGLGRKIGWLSTAQFAAMLVLGVGFFFFLPRTARAAMERWMPSTFHVSGFANNVTLGQIGVLRQSSTPVMHARLYNTVPAHELKWRGATLALFDGKRWYNPPVRQAARVRVDNNLVLLSAAPQQARAGRRVFYDVQTQPSSPDVLFFLGTPELVQIDTHELERLPDSGYRLPSGGAFRYGARSLLADTNVADPRLPPLNERERAEYLQLPEIDPRVADLANSIAPGADARKKSEAMETFLSTRFGYTTDLPSSPPKDPIADFLFRRKEGHCEYFASAMAVMLRSQGIPSRLVTGYQTGVYNPLTQWYLIRASDAHSWVEAWLPGYGWRSFDPTPAAPAAESLGVLGRIQLFADAMEVFWQEWIVGYDQERQLALAGRVGRSRRWPVFRWEQWEAQAVRTWKTLDWRRAVAYGVGAAGLIALLLMLPRLARYWRGRVRKQRALSGHAVASDATLLYLHLEELLKRKGLARPAFMTPMEFASSSDVRTAVPLAADVTRAYNDLRFGNDNSSAGRLAQLLSELEAALRGKSQG